MIESIEATARADERLNNCVELDVGRLRRFPSQPPARDFRRRRRPVQSTTIDKLPFTDSLARVQPASSAIPRVCVIVLENQGFDTTFGPESRAP